VTEKTSPADKGVAGVQAGGAEASAGWYTLSAEDVATRLRVGVDKGLSASEAAGRLAKDGPNALPTEMPTPEWRRFLDEYCSFMQLVSRRRRHRLAGHRVPATRTAAP
jgi:hypothetical protein